MDIRRLYGVVCASVCPMREDGSIDLKGVRRLTRHLIEGGINCLYPNGTNGESLSLTLNERFEVARAILGENAGEAVFYNQCGASSVAESYAHVRFTRDLGADGAGLMTPVFFPVDEAAMRKYFADILPEVKDMPVYAYNIPTRSGNDLSAETLGALMTEFDNLMGVKYSFPDISRIQKYVKCCHGRRASVLIGSDSMATYCVLAGGDGWVSGPSAVWPKRHAALYRALTANDMETARSVQYKIVETAEAMRDIPEIPAIKYMLKQIGVIETDYCRPPLRPLTADEKKRLDKLIDY